MRHDIDKKSHKRPTSFRFSNRSWSRIYDIFSNLVNECLHLSRMGTIIRLTGWSQFYNQTVCLSVYVNMEKALKSIFCDGDRWTANLIFPNKDARQIYFNKHLYRHWKYWEIFSKRKLRRGCIDLENDDIKYEVQCSVAVCVYMCTHRIFQWTLRECANWMNLILFRVEKNVGYYLTKIFKNYLNANNIIRAITFFLYLYL
jgi:hypothetical protein